MGRRPSTRHHYRAQKLALWQELIPKINQDDGSDPKSHLLDQYDNMSTFDDYDNLINNLDSLFPSPPPMPPSRPISIGNQNKPGVTVDYNNNGLDPDIAGTGNPLGDKGSQHSSGGGKIKNGDAGGASGDAKGEKGSVGNQVDGRGKDGTDGKDGSDGGDGVTSEVTNTGNASGQNTTKTSEVPLSMVVAIGGSLLLINILIFAGLCYQRERIRKMRMVKTDDPADMNFDDPRYHRRKLEAGDSSTMNSLCGGAGGGGATFSGNIGGGGGGGPECTSLMSASSSHHQHHCQGHSQRKNSIEKTYAHNSSPQPSNHSRSRTSQSRSSPPIDSVNCSYAPLPTNVTSPVHRPTSRGNAGPSSLPSSTAGSAIPTHPPNPASTSSVGSSSGVGGVSSTTNANHAPTSSTIISSANTGVGSGGGDLNSGTYVNNKPRGQSAVVPPPAISRPIMAAPSGDRTLNANGGNRVVGGTGKSAFVAAAGSASGPGKGSSTTPSGSSGGAGTGIGGLTTFGPGYHNSRVGRLRAESGDSNSSGKDSIPFADANSGSGGSGSSAGSAGSGSGGGGDAVYKTINKSGQNNAVTIV